MFLIKLILRYLRRRPGRTIFTVLGVASAMLLFVSVESLSHGLDSALDADTNQRTLVVYRKNRYCPQTSFLPERYAKRIRELDGVESVLPVKVYLSNCRASLDIVAFQGTPVDELFGSRNFNVISGDEARFRRERNSALVGQEFAARRGLDPGDVFRFGDINVDVAGIFASQDPVEDGLILTHLEFLQRAGPVDRLGTVTQFEVRIADAGETQRLTREIDDIFRTAEEPTHTRPRAEFLNSATRELREILRFGRGFGIVCVLVVLVLVSNTVLMSVRERNREFGVFLTLGYRGRHLLGLVLGETLMLTLIGTGLGLLGAFCLISWSHLSIGVEGVNIGFSLSVSVFAVAVGLALVVALIAGILPAVRAARADVTDLLRSV
jgi:putative ABC transport system permease protein